MYKFLFEHKFSILLGICMPGSRIAGSYGNFVLDFLIKLPLFKMRDLGKVTSGSQMFQETPFKLRFKLVIGNTVHYVSCLK